MTRGVCREERLSEDQGQTCGQGTDTQQPIADIEHELDVLQRDGVVLEPLPAHISYHITARKQSRRQWRHECQ